MAISGAPLSVNPIGANPAASGVASPLTASLVAGAALTATLSRGRPLTISFAAKAALTATPSRDRPIAANLVSGATLAAALRRGRPLTANLAAGAVLSVSLRSLHQQPAALAATATLTASLRSLHQQTAALAATATLAVPLIRVPAPVRGTLLSNSESQVRAQLRKLLLLILPDGVEVIRAQINNVPEPSILDYVVITPGSRTRLSTNWVNYLTDAFGREAIEPTQIDFQLDVHGPNSPDNSQIVVTLFRDSYTADWFDQNGGIASPLYTSEPRQVPFINGESQYEDRWTIDVSMQVNPVVTTIQDYTDDVMVQPFPIDYSPGVP